MRQKKDQSKKKGITDNVMSIEGLKGVKSILADRSELFEDTGDPASVNYACFSAVPMISRDAVCSGTNAGLCSMSVWPAEKIIYSS